MVQLANDDVELRVRVLNNGRALEPGFDLNKATGLGLSIVRTLVTTELAGSLTMRAGESARQRAASMYSRRRSTSAEPRMVRA